jgi:threonine dehydrogenase-like Zn-dependent dehydrogenase
MLAMNYRGPYRVRTEEKPYPEILHPNDAIVRVIRTCICGSDLHLYHGMVPDTRVGMTFGHEVIGIVEDIGPSVENLKKGDMVIVPFNIACGKCTFCKQGLFSACHETNSQSTAMGGTYGYSHLAGGYEGGQAEYVRVPFADVGPTLLPVGLDYDDAVLLTDVVPTGYQAAEMGGIKEGDTVVVFGAGPVGLMAAKSAWLFGAGRVIIIDHLDYRLEFARSFAQCEAYNFKEMDDPVLFLKKTTDWFGADVCIDAVGGDAEGSLMQTIQGKKMKLLGGSSVALQWAINSVKKGGIISIVGVYGPIGSLVPVGNIVNKGLTIRAAQCSVARLLPRLIKHVMDGILEPSRMITHRFPLSEISDAYRMFSAKLDNMIKPVIIPVASF